MESIFLSKKGYREELIRQKDLYRIKIMQMEKAIEEYEKMIEETEDRIKRLDKYFEEITS